MTRDRLKFLDSNSTDQNRERGRVIEMVIEMMNEAAESGGFGIGQLRKLAAELERVRMTKKEMEGRKKNES